MWFWFYLVNTFDFLNTLYFSQSGRTPSKHTYTWADKADRISLYWFQVVIFNNVSMRLPMADIRLYIIHSRYENGPSLRILRCYNKEKNLPTASY